MATSMGPNFSGGHPAGMGHPGVAGHAMGPGVPHNPGQQGAPGGGMPHQFAGGTMAVSAPGGQVNPALMSGMPPGANPHAHALQQLNPQQQQLLQQQQQQFQNQCTSVAQTPIWPALLQVTSVTNHAAVSYSSQQPERYGSHAATPAAAPAPASSTDDGAASIQWQLPGQRYAYGDAAQSSADPSPSAIRQASSSTSRH